MSWAGWILVAVQLFGVAMGIRRALSRQELEVEVVTPATVFCVCLGYGILYHHAGLVLNWAGWMLLAELAIGCVASLSQILFEGVRLRSSLFWKVASAAITFYLYYEAGIFGGDVQGPRF